MSDFDDDGNDDVEENGKGEKKSEKLAWEL